MKKNILIIALSLFLFSCDKQSNVNNNTSNNNNTLNKEKLIIQKIKKRTIRDLKKLGIKKILLSKNGEWWEIPGTIYTFYKNGKVKVNRKGMDMGYFYWKVENGKLYMNPNKVINIRSIKKNKFYLIKVEYYRPTGYDPTNLEHLEKKYKYSLSLSSSDENVNLLINFILN